MLVAGASLSLLAPISAQASNVVNLDEMESYTSSKTKSSRIDSNTFINEVSEDLANLKSRVDGLEVKQQEFEAGGFSDTTVMTGKVVFDVGAVDGYTFTETTSTTTANTTTGALTTTSTSTQVPAEAVSFNYMYQINLNTSFTGDDDLYVRLKAGNASGALADTKFGSYLSSTKTGTDALAVDKIWYSFPIGDNNTFWVGPRIENYYMHGASPSIYKPITKQFKLGGNGAAYGASTNSGLGWAYNGDNGFSLSSNVVSKQNASQKGFLTDEAATNWSTQVAYTTDSYHVSLISAIKSNGWTDSYYTTSLGKARPEGNSTNYGLRAYWRPDDSGAAVPEISAGYDVSSVDGQDADTDAYFVGLTWKDSFQADDKIGIAFGQPQTADTDTVEPFAWEAYYSFKINDSVTMTPAVFGASDRTGTSGDDVTGAVLQTTFKF